MKNTNEDKVIIITLNYDQSAYSIECIRSILDSDYLNFEILILDNGSGLDDFINLRSELNSLNDSRIKIYRIEDNIGYVGGINFCLEKAKTNEAEYVLILNNDTLIDPYAIRNLVQTSKKHENLAITSGKIYNFDDVNSLQYIGQKEDPKGMLNDLSVIKNGYEIDHGQYDDESEMGMLDDIFWMFHISLYEKIGGYSKYFFVYGK